MGKEASILLIVFSANICTYIHDFFFFAELLVLNLWVFISGVGKTFWSWLNVRVGRWRWIHFGAVFWGRVLELNFGGN